MISTPTDIKTRTDISLDLEQYGIFDAHEVIRNPSFDTLYAEETAAGLDGYEKGFLTESGAISVDTGIFTGRSPIATRTSRFAQPAQKETVFFTDILKQNGYWVGADGRGHHLHGRKAARGHMKEQMEASEMFVHDRFDHIEVGKTKNEWLPKISDTFSAIIEF